jgi:hypothetical protein
LELPARVFSPTLAPGGVASALLFEPGMKKLNGVWILSAGLLVALGCSASGSSSSKGDLPVADSHGTGSPTSGGADVGMAAPGPGTGTTTITEGPAMTGKGSTGSETLSSPPPSTGTAGSAGTTTTTTTGSGNVSGSLTAGTWDDNLNFDFYQKYLAAMNASQVGGLPLIDRTNRLEITAVDGAGAALAGAQVTVSGAVGKLFEATTRSDGKLFFFPGTVGAQAGDALTIAGASGQASGTATASVGDASARVTLAGAQAAPVASLDLAIVVDTTGSMGDELEYLKAEMSDIIARVSHDFPNVSQRWSAVFYRDVVDEYVVRAFDFTSDLATLESEIKAQSAAGGGDYPEAPDQALAKLAKLSWRPDAAARMAFWVADAPHHDADAQTMAQDILLAHGLGIRFYPISASGTDDLLEYTMRAAAEVTGGRYLFLTNDSGIGNSHKEPTIPCYVVTTLDKAMYRMIGMELTGTDVPPTAGDIIRTSGDPKDGTCVLQSGDIVTVL